MATPLHRVQYYLLHISTRLVSIDVNSANVSQVFRPLMEKTNRPPFSLTDVMTTQAPPTFSGDVTKEQRVLLLFLVFPLKVSYFWGIGFLANSGVEVCFSFLFFFFFYEHVFLKKSPFFSDCRNLYDYAPRRRLSIQST